MPKATRVGDVIHLNFGDGSMIDIRKEDDGRWRVLYKSEGSFSYSCAATDVIVCLREVWKYAQIKKLPEEELKLIKDIATSKMLKDWIKENE